MSARILSSSRVAGLSGSWAPCARVTAALALLAASAPLFADGTEVLGPPAGFGIAAGSDIIAAGVGVRGTSIVGRASLGANGMTAAAGGARGSAAKGLGETTVVLGGAGSGTGTLVVSVPAGDAVRQVLLYWEGQESTEAGQGPTDTITLDGTIDVTGERIGGATGFQPISWTSTYRADITALDLVTQGTNAIAISGLDFDRANNGAGVLVVVDDGATAADLEILDGNDFAFANFAPPLDSTAPLTFFFAPSHDVRSGRLRMFLGSGALDDSTGGFGQPSTIDIMIDGVLTEQLVDPLANGDGNEWDTISRDVIVPAGATSLTVQARSHDTGAGPFAGHVPASFTLVAAGFAIAQGPITGACCLGDGACIVDSESACTEGGGAYQGDSTTCAGVSCGQPNGACCLAGGSCNEDTEEACQDQGGAYQGDFTNCATTDCPVLGGACCFIGETCIETSVDDCATADGTYQGDGTFCAATLCPELVGGCCLPTGLCAQLTLTRCTALAGRYLGDYSSCEGVECVLEGACCATDGSCTETTSDECAQTDGTYQGDETTCAEAECPLPKGACCATDGSCADTTGDTCSQTGGTYEGDGSTCDDTDCPLPKGACCATDGSCADTTGDTCSQTGGTYEGDGSTCDDTECALPEGACCLPNGTCTETTEGACADMGGAYQGDDTRCSDVTCPPPPPSDRGCGSEKGSVVVFSKVELRWDSDGLLIQDTFLSLVNDHPDEVSVQLYFINGDEPLDAENGERSHSGWNWVDNQMVLTGHQPTHWSAARGAPAAGGLSPFVVLDAGSPPGRPDPAGSSDRVLRGYVIAWAIGANGAEIRFNHLAGNGTLVNSRDGTAWEYSACTFKAIGAGIANGAPTGDPGVLNFDGIEFALPYSTLLLQFQAVGSTAFSRVGPDPVTTVTSTTDVTLHPLDVDLRQETDGPVTTKASIEVWNENETKFSGAHRCITCWDQSLLDLYEEGANHFLFSALQTDHGKARIDGLASALCNENYDLGDGLPLGEDPRDVVSANAALLGLAAKFLTIGSAGEAAAGGQLIGMGVQPAVILHDPSGAMPPESNAPPASLPRRGGLMDAPLDEGTDPLAP